MNNWLIFIFIIISILMLPGWWALLPVLGFWAME
jgi:hypothetical protein